MNIGDLVRYSDEDGDEDPRDPNFLGLGLVTGFDKDGDPIVWFRHDLASHGDGGTAFYTHNLRVINEHR